jgi:hypothetical protein
VEETQAILFSISELDKGMCGVLLLMEEKESSGILE